MDCKVRERNYRQASIGKQAVRQADRHIDRQINKEAQTDITTKDQTNEPTIPPLQNTVAWHEGRETNKENRNKIKGYGERVEVRTEGRKNMHE